jgi:hypothetical protein
MQEFLTHNGTELVVFGFILLVVGVVSGAVCFHAVQWRKVRQAEIDAFLSKTELEASLKQDLVNRGLSADEIKQILEASLGGPSRPAGFAAFFRGLFKRAECAKAKAGLKDWEGLGKQWEDFGKMWGGCEARHGARRESKNL